MGDKLKAAFLGLTDKGKESLGRSRDARAQQAFQDIAAARKKLTEIPNGHPQKEILAGEVESQDAMVKATLKRPVGDAFKALAPLCDKAHDLLVRVNAAADSANDKDKQFQLVDLNLAAIRRAALKTPNEKAAATTLSLLDPLEKRRAALNKLPRPDDLATKLDDLLQDAVKLLKTAREGIDTEPDPGSAREESRAVLGTMADIDGLDGILDPDLMDMRGRRNAAEESAARLNVFDEHFKNPGTDDAAQIENESMRTAAVIRAAAQQQARTRNDPTMSHRLGSLMVDEYGPDLKMSDETKALTKALVMDDPIEKLLTGKIRAEDAVQRIRDQAAVGGVKPSDMLRMLRNQFEMKMGSLDMTTDVENVELGNDSVEKTSPGGRKSNETQAFVLQDLQGEIDPAFVTGNDMFGANGPTFQGNTLKYEGRGAAIMDALTKVLAAWDAKEVAVPDKLGAQEPTFSGKGKTPELPKPVTGNVPLTSGGITPEMLAKGASGLTRAGDRKTINALNRKTDEVVEKDLTATPYVTAPGLGQNHSVTGPLDNPEGRKPEDRAKSERDALHGALDGREYAHLRMLQRADEEDKKVKSDYKGQQLTPEEVVRKYMADTYGMTANQVDEMLKKVAEAFETVPLTITFTAESMFSSKKDAPSHGTEYVSDVVYTRGREDASTLIGRGDNIGIDSSDTMIEVKQQQIDALQGILKDLNKTKDEEDDVDKIKALEERIEAQERALKKAQAELVKLQKKKQKGPQGEQDPKIGVTGGGGGDGWKNDRGVNYQRWRPDKDRREGRLDEGMLLDNAQTFGAVNPSFDKTQGSSSDTMDGTNYYGNAHFLLRDTVRGRAAYSVRGAGISVGGGKSAVQRTDLMMMLYDMIKGGGSNLRYIDAIALLAKGGAKALTTATDWEIHIYGGFDMTKDAEAIYLSSKVEEPVRGRIARFAGKNGIKLSTSIPDGKAVISQGNPVKQELLA
jgi:hypothetical protein